jgi:chemotaxis protein histidine kinase CheA
MSDERREEAFSLESLGGDPKEHARSQLALLEQSLESCREPSETAALMDEAYRAAHALKGAVDSQEAPNVDRLARRMQDIVRAARSGTLAVTLELGSVLASIARVARDALEEGPGVEPLSVSSASATLEEILEHPSAWSAPPGLIQRAFEWARVEAGRLSAAGEAARVAREAYSAYSRAAAESGAVMDGFQEALSAHRKAVESLRGEIPGALAAAARGEATASSAVDLVDSLSRLSSLAAEMEKPLSRSAAAVKEASLQGRRSADIAEGAFASLVSVRLDALLEFLPRLVRSLARRHGIRLDLVQEPTNVEVLASRSEAAVALITRCVRAAVGAMAAAPSRKRRSGSHSLPRGSARLSVFARAAGDSLHLRLALAGPMPDTAALNESLAGMKRRLLREGAGLDAEAKKGESASILLTLRSAASVSSRTGEFVFARSGEAWYAIPSPAVVECIDGGLSMPEYVLEGARLPTLRMNDTVDPHRAMVVKTPRGAAVLLFDGIGSRETGLQTSGGGDAPRIAGIAGTVRRADGSSARLLDLTVLLPQPR